MAISAHGAAFPGPVRSEGGHYMLIFVGRERSHMQRVQLLLHYCIRSGSRARSRPADEVPSGWSRAVRAGHVRDQCSPNDPRAVGPRGPGPWFVALTVAVVVSWWRRAKRAGPRL